MHAPFERLGFDRRMTKEEINSLPIRSYPGKIKVINTRDGLDKAVHELNKESLLGFDTETRPNYLKGQDHLPSLLQLAGEKCVYLFQLKHLNFPEKLRKILETERIIKCGVAVDQDIIQLQKITTFIDDGFVELSKVAKASGIRNHGLRGMTAVLLGFRISKSAQRSNWATDILTEKQIRYAATDAWVGRELYLILKEMGVIYHDIFL
ncbi:MAG: 3'-5' exonuclease domain-containing protein 2 [Proteobacteria bacterium]|nr:3'-5' exonuclease domain-containing protein 2 [Pseudomonadota bacterium]MBU1738584.1 3'-5' exonuclease domain-containing protein 2 [Pseudomonadota bacterium]